VSHELLVFGSFVSLLLGSKDPRIFCVKELVEEVWCSPLGPIKDVGHQADKQLRKAAALSYTWPCASCTENMSKAGSYSVSSDELWHQRPYGERARRQPNRLHFDCWGCRSVVIAQRASVGAGPCGVAFQRALPILRWFWL